MAGGRGKGTVCVRGEGGVEAVSCGATDVPLNKIEQPRRSPDTDNCLAVNNKCLCQVLIVVIPGKGCLRRI